MTILDPTYVSFGLNPLSLPQGADGANRVQMLQTQVEELSALLSDVFNTDAATAPRLMWVFKGALYYLYTLDDGPTFKDLYRILVDFISLPEGEIETMLRRKELEDEIIRSTIDAISKLQKDAFAPVVNRISNFVLPPQSITSRTFCARTSKLDFDEMTRPGRLTIFRITKSLPYDFRRLISASIVDEVLLRGGEEGGEAREGGGAAVRQDPDHPRDGRVPEHQRPEAPRHDPLRVEEVRALPLDGEPEHPADTAGALQLDKRERRARYSASGWGRTTPRRWPELISPKMEGGGEGRPHHAPRLHAAWSGRGRTGRTSAGKPLLLEPFPKVSEPLCEMKEVIDYMKERDGGEVRRRRTRRWTSSTRASKSRSWGRTAARKESDLEGPLHARPLEDTHDRLPQAPLRRLLARVLAPQVGALPEVLLEDLRRPAGAQRPGQRRATSRRPSRARST